MQGSRTKRYCRRVKDRSLVLGFFTDGSHLRVQDRALVLESMTEGSYPRVQDRTFIGIISKSLGPYDSFAFENEGATVFQNVGNN
jgi:hypothetical protein